MNNSMPPAIILCGGKGTRLRDVTELLPKPMVPIGEQPILWHILKSYSAFGVRRFILCLGYKREIFIDYFMNYHMRISDVTITLGHEPEIQFHDDIEEADWQITLAGTGLDTMTGGRVAKVMKYLRPEDENFFLTYGDGVSDINIAATLDMHLKGNKLATVSAVHPAARFGELILSDNTVIGFEEKPAKIDGYINGGFMVINRGFVDKYIPLDEDVFFESKPMNNAVADNQMQVYKHEGFWQCMDTPREYQMLTDMWNSNKAPWTKYWKR